ncbi:cobalamin biosynthesis protein CobW, partial [Streptomyces sp. NPDC054838]
MHADARKETVEHLLRSVPGSIALHHDLSSASDGNVLRTLRDCGGAISADQTPLVNDCACCALREDLVPALKRLAAGGPTSLAVVELWDSVEPRAMAEVIVAHGGGVLELTNVITAVDPALVLPCLGNGDDLAEAGLAAAATHRRPVGDPWARPLECPAVRAIAARGEADEEGPGLRAQR